MSDANDINGGMFAPGFDQNPALELKAQHKPQLPELAHGIADNDKITHIFDFLTYYIGRKLDFLNDSTLRTGWKPDFLCASFSLP
jgi:hypothetical protein